MRQHKNEQPAQGSTARTHREESAGDYSLVSVAVLHDPNLSLDATGLYAVLALFDEDEPFTVEALLELTSDDEATVTAALDELTRAGYVKLDAAEGHGLVYIVGADA